MKTFFFRFRCVRCGEYTVEEKTFLSFLTDLLRRRLDRKRESAKGAVLTFSRGGCPRCRKKGESTPSLSLMK
jgi:hypothetical protein